VLLLWLWGVLGQTASAAVHTHTHTLAHTHVDTPTHIFAHKYTHARAHTHTHTHTRTRSGGGVCGAPPLRRLGEPIRMNTGPRRPLLPAVCCLFCVRRLLCVLHAICLQYGVRCCCLLSLICVASVGVTVDEHWTKVLPAACCLLSVVCCLLSAACCLLSAVCRLLPAILSLSPLANIHARTRALTHI
jgi:hypothetical protein